MQFTFSGLSKGTPYQVLCATSAGPVSIPLPFVTTGGLNAPVLVTPVPSAPSFEISIKASKSGIIRCIASLSGPQPTSYDVLRGFVSANTPALISTNSISANIGELYTFTIAPVTQNTAYMVFCASSDGSRSPGLNVLVGNGPNCQAITTCRDCSFSGCVWNQFDLSSPTTGGSCGISCNSTYCAPGNLDCTLIDCQYGFWSDFSSCSQPCSGGVRTRSRTLLKASATHQNCEAVQTQSTTCNTQPCISPTIDPVPDQVYTAVTGYSLPMNFTYTRSVESYSVQKQISLTGITDGGDKGQSINVYASSSNSELVRAPFVQYVRNSSIATLIFELPEAEVGTASVTITIIDSGSRNSGPMSKTTSFAVTVLPNPVDCQASYTAFSDCSKSCNGGVRSQRQVIVTPARSGGQPCQLPLNVRQESCNTEACIDLCQWMWSDWSTCSPKCGAGTMHRTKIITSPAFTCVNLDNAIDIRPCSTPCPVNCNYTYGKWGGCTASCGGGNQTLQAIIVQPALNGGLACPLPLPSIVRACNTISCGQIGPSCTNYCGSMPPGGSCHCDAQCLKFGDCCKDYKDVCNQRASSCSSRCGDYTPGLCACDDKCEQTQDCCQDKAALCTVAPVAPALGCLGKCGAQASNGCWCDERCQQTGDCCSDYNKLCQQVNSANSCVGRCVASANVQNKLPAVTSSSQPYNPYGAYSQYRSFVDDSASGFGVTKADIGAGIGFGLSKNAVLDLVGTKQFVGSYTSVPAVSTSNNIPSRSLDQGCLCSPNCKTLGNCCADYLLVCSGA